MQTVVIIGAGDAGLSAALSASKYSKVILVTPSDIFYPKCPLTSFVAGEVKEEALVKKIYSFFHMNRNVEVKIGVATRIDRKNKLVFTEEESFDYDRLIIATGSIPILIEVEGVDEKKILALSTMEDAEKIKQLSKEAKGCCIIGGGILGCELALAIRKLGLDVSIFEEKERILDSFCKEISKLVQEELESSRVKVSLGFQVDKDKNMLQEFDFIVCCVGISPEIGIAEKAGLKVGGGIVVSSSMRTSDRDIFAAGDCAEINGVVSGLGSVAERQGHVAGLAACRKQVSFFLADARSSKVGGVEFARVGGDGPIVGVAKREGVFLRTYFEKDGVLIGAEAAGKASHYLIDVLSFALQKKSSIKDLLAFNYSYHPKLSTPPSLVVLAAEVARRRMEVYDCGKHKRTA